MKSLYLVPLLAMFFSGNALADLNCAKFLANEKIDQNHRSLEVAKSCVKKAVTETALAECGVDKFPDDSQAQKMEEVGSPNFSSEGAGKEDPCRMKCR